MVEILVAVIVLSVGLLGLAHLQLFGMDATDTSYRRGLATNIANDLADRMRANRPAALAGAYNGLDSDDYFTSDPKSPSNLPANPGCIATGCTAAEMAALDQREWLNYFVNVSDMYIDKSKGGADWLPALEGGRGRLLRTATRFEVEITWANTEEVWDAVKKVRKPETRTQTFSMEFDL